MGQLAVFKVGEEVFGIDILLTKEISRIHDITPIPATPLFIMGLMNLRGQVVTVVKPSILMGKSESKINVDSRLLIIKTHEQADILLRRGLLSEVNLGNDSLALLIDNVGDVFEYKEESIEPPPPHIEEKHKELVSGVVQLTNSLVIILNIEEFFIRIQKYLDDIKE